MSIISFILILTCLICLVNSHGLTSNNGIPLIPSLRYSSKLSGCIATKFLNTNNVISKINRIRGGSGD